jgi:hypothetical protein
MPHLHCPPDMGEDENDAFQERETEEVAPDQQAGGVRALGEGARDEDPAWQEEKERIIESLSTKRRYYYRGRSSRG